HPLVTVLIPVYNRAALAAEAVESCLAQVWRPLEILVIDDGSTDDLAATLARFGETVRVWRQPNGGVSSARNAGIRMAAGDFVHFLDSDNLLLPTAVSRKLDAFACLADAELCYSLAEVRGERTPDLPRIVPPDGSARCPTTDLLALDLRYPFYVSCVMLPRWTLLDAGGFEEDLRNGEDSRFWVKLALRGTKAVGLGTPLTVRRLTPDGLSVNPTLPAVRFIVKFRNIVDLLRQRRGWQTAARSFPDLLHAAIDEGFRPPPPDLSARAISDLLAAIGELGDGSRRDGISPLPLLAHLRHLTKGAIDAAGARDRARADLLARLFAAIHAAAQGAAPIGQSDVAFWANAEVTRSGKSRINSLLARVNAQVGGDPALISISEQLLRHAVIVPPKRTIDVYARMRRWSFPPRAAMWLARRFVGASERFRTR
ncbi:MAG: glycosyltransferase family A protein, partial [Dongiaceae bacterium]